MSHSTCRQKIALFCLIQLEVSFIHDLIIRLTLIRKLLGPSAAISPMKIRRSRVIKNYLKSPSPKKKIKEGHCNFCALHFATAEKLEAHLRQNSQCSTFYLRTYKTKSLDPILVSQFPCFYCQVRGSIKLGYHLKKNPFCERKYYEKFNVKTIEELKTLITNLKKRMVCSRSRVSRSLEYIKTKEKKKASNHEVQSSHHLLNSFRKETCFANVNMCYKCKKNICNGEILSLQDISEIQGEEIEPNLRRFQSFFRCKDCSNGESKDTKAKFDIYHLFVEGKKLCIPSVMLQNSPQDQSQEVDGEAQHFCLFPSTLEALQHVSSVGVKSRSGDDGVMYKLDPNIDDVISISYENELHKYKMAKFTSDRFQGTFKEGEEKMLDKLEKVSYDHVLVGSDSWHKVGKELTLKRMEQFGAICFSLSVSMPVQRDDIIASCLIQSGIVVTVNFVESSSTTEIEAEYYVHSHSSGTDCDDLCVKEKLESYLSRSGSFDLNSIRTKFLGTHLISIQKKMQSFVKYFLKDKSSPIFSEDYSIKISFSQDGSVKMTGYFWPREFNQLNEQVSKYPTSMVDQEIISNAIKFIDTNISTSTDSLILKSQLNVSDYESRKLADLAKKEQNHFCGQINCKECSNPCLPALETDFTISPDQNFSQNIVASSKFRKIMIEKLKSSNENEIKSKLAEDWLNETFNSFEWDVIEEDGSRIWQLDGQTSSLTFLIDQRLLDLTGKYHDRPMLALYHYCLTCRSIDEAFEVVIKTKNMQDCYTKPYHVILLKAFHGKMEILPVNGFCKERSLEVSDDTGLDIKILDDEVKLTHRVICLEEAFSLLDKSLERTANSTSSEYIAAYPDRKIFFKKVSNETNETFKADGKSGYFEKQYSNIDKYLNRRNGTHISLAEFCLNYDFLGNEESRQLFKLFSKNKEIKINDSEVRSAFDPKKFLPELIVTSSGQVMKIRSTRKLLYYPEFDDLSKESYRKVLMFFPISKDPTMEEVKVLYKKCDEGVESSNYLTIVNRIERILFPKKNFSFS